MTVQHIPHKMHLLKPRICLWHWSLWRSRWRRVSPWKKLWWSWWPWKPHFWKTNSRTHWHRRQVNLRIRCDPNGACDTKKVLGTPSDMDQILSISAASNIHKAHKAHVLVGPLYLLCRVYLLFKVQVQLDGTSKRSWKDSKGALLSWMPRWNHLL